MMHDPTPSLARLARLARHRTSLMASVLDAYRAQQGLNDSQLAMMLHCDEQALDRLALCRRPTSGSGFRAEVEQIASYAACDARILAQLVRAVESWQALRQAPIVRSAPLMAARDRDELDDDETPAGEQPNDE